ncbi:MAG: tetratricopeptide repeat protein [Bacteroidetes bacterium]|nr:tetratricopeptide repeat protein [Bacteroidota bacterium]
MNKRTAIYIFLFGLFFLICIALFSQKTMVYTNLDADFKLALELFQKQKFGSAQKQFSKIISHYGNEPHNLIRIDAEYYSALCALELFNKDAELLLKNFISVHPESPRTQTAYFQLGKYNYRKKQYNKALEWFAKVDVYDLNNEELSEFYFKRGYSFFEEDSMVQAKKDFFEIKDIDNKYASPATYYYGHISYREKNYQTALQHFQKLKRNENFGAIVPYYIAQIFFLQEKYDSAIVYAKPLLDSGNVKRVPELTKIMGESYYRTSKYNEAIPYLEKYKSLAGNLNRNEWYQLGYAYYKIEKFSEAIPCFQNSIAERDSISQNAHYHLGDCYVRVSIVEKKSLHMLAKNSFEAAYKIDFDKSITEDALFNYAKLCYELSYSPFNEALSALSAYINKYPDSPRLDECYKYLVNVYLSTKNYKEAMKSIESMKSLNEEMKTAYQKISFLYGLQLFANNHLQETIIYLNKSLTHPVNSTYTSLAHYWKGETFYQMSEKAGMKFGLDSSILSYKTFLSSPGAINNNEFFAAHYNLGYANFKKENYSEANVWFRKYAGLKSNEPKEKMNDAYLRIGDGFFMMKDYTNAVDYYDEALKTGKRDADYALYQKALAQGVLGKKEAKVNTLAELLSNYSGKQNLPAAGRYEAAAKFELANTYVQLNNDENALAYYKKVVNEHPETSFTPRALLQIGRIEAKKKEYDHSLATLDKVLASYPKTTEAFEAIRAMRDIYKAKGDMDAYEAKLKNIPYAAVTLASLDSSNYDVAFDFYDKGDCDNAIKNFTKYMEKYPNGIFLIQANYYKAECDFKNKNYEAALGGYQYVLDKPLNAFTESSLLKGAGINYRNKNYESALKQYGRLAEVAEYPANASEGKTGTMRCFFNVGKLDSASAAAKKVLEIEKVSDETKAEAHFIIGKNYSDIKYYDLAAKEFLAVTYLTTSEKSAEAKYNIAYNQFLTEQYKESQKTIFELINQQPGYDYWIGKGFILLSDDYAALKDLFNAKYALQALIEKSSNIELVTIAKEKLNRLNEIEAKAKAEAELKKEKKVETEIQFKPDNPKDSALYKQEGK